MPLLRTVPLAALLIAARAAPAVTLAEAVDAAVALQPGLEIPEARLEESRAIAGQADSLFAADPAISVRHYNDGVGSGDGAREWEAGVDAPIWLPGQRAARQSVAQAAAGQSEAAARTRRWQVAGLVRERAWDVAMSRARSAHLAQALEDARRLQAAVERRVQAGELPRSELLLAERGTLSLEVDWLGAGAAQERAEAAWRFHTGLADVPGDLVESPFTPMEIGTQHPGLALAQADAERAAAEQRRARSDRRANPVVKMGARHERGDADEPWNDAISVGINVPLGLPSQSAPATAAAQVVAVESGVARERTWRALNEELIAARSMLEYARRELETARRVEALAAESLRFAELAFSVGEEDLFKLLQMKQQALEAEWKAARLDLAVGRAIARCNQAAGLVPGYDSQ